MRPTAWPRPDDPSIDPPNGLRAGPARPVLRRLAVAAALVLVVLSTTVAADAARRDRIEWRDPSAVVTFRGGWSAAACNDVVPMICVERNGRPVGTIEARAFPVESFPDPDLARRHPLRFLRALAAEAEASQRADRPEVCGADYVVDATGPKGHRVAGTPGIAFAFEGAFPGQPTSERIVVHLALIDDHVVSINASAHDPEGCFAAEEAFTVEDLRAFRRHLRTLVSRLPAPTFLWEDEPGPGSPPSVAVSVGDDTVLLDAEGVEVLRIPLLERATLDDMVVAGTGPGGGAGIALGISANAFDAGNGEQLWSVVHARAAIVLDEGRRTAILPDVFGQRDPQVNSIWMREDDGTERLVVQFANGEPLPGYDPGFEGDNGTLSVSFDDDASVVVVTQGNDVSLFVYDVFAVDVATGEVTRLTSGKQSRSGAASPDGARVAYQRDVEVCGPLHVRAADLMLVSVDGSGERVLAAGSCESWLFNPRWISASEVVAYRAVATGPGQFAVDIVVLDVDSGTSREITSDGTARYFSVDADERRILYTGPDPGRFTLLDLDDDRSVDGHVEGATDFPRLSGDHQWP